MMTIPRRGFPAIAAWACFLGCSWTWVIGMVLPVLLVRDYGLLGWVAFAAPNVVGAAAMGFVLRNETISKRTAAAHPGALFWFSIVTVAFHLFVVGWLLPPLLGIGLAVLAAGIVAWFAVLQQQRDAAALAGGIVAAGLSYGALIFAQDLPGAWTAAGTMPGASRLGWSGLGWFLPAAVAGFALCPYLDLTFHRARQSTEPIAGRGAFAIGFGVVFLLMIVFSLCYAGLLIPVVAGEDFPQADVWRVLLGIHLSLQVTYTCGLHLREVNETRQGLINRTLAIGLLAVAMVGGWLAGRWPGGGALPGGGAMTFGELGYRGFMTCYGTVFPSYVFLCMVPTRWEVGRGVRLGVFAGVTPIVAAMGYLGFTAGPGWWVGLAVGLLVLARGVIDVLAWRRRS